MEMNDSELELEMTYAWTGWKEVRKEEDKNNVEVEPDFSNSNKEEKKTAIGRASKNKIFIATFKQVEVYNNILPESYFSRNGQNVILTRNDLKGKITIPKSINNSTFTIFNNFNS